MVWGQAEVVHLGRARERSAECWHVELAGSVYAETNLLWLKSVIFAVEPAPLWRAKA